MVNPFETYAEKRTDPFVKYLRKKDVLEKVDQQLTPAIKSFVKTTFERGHAQVIPNIPELIAQELKKLPPRIIEKILEKETVIKEVTKEDKRKYAEEKSLEILKEEIGSIKEIIERLKSFAVHGGGGVIGLPAMGGYAGQFLTTNGSQPSWSVVIPSGLISLWKGTIASIPSGWLLCDGTNGTPDLRNRFVVGANADSGGLAKSTITGSALQTGGNTSHAHSFSGVTNSDSDAGAFLSCTTLDFNAALNPHDHCYSGTTVACTHINPFFALAFIMKS